MNTHRATISETQHFNISAKREAAGLSVGTKRGESQAAGIKRMMSARKRELSTVRRSFPKYAPGMSTADYVRQYEELNGKGAGTGFWSDLNTEPAALYEGGSFDFAPIMEEIPEDSAPVETSVCEPAEVCEAAPSEPAEVSAPADAPQSSEPAADPGAAADWWMPRPSVYRAHIKTAELARTLFPVGAWNDGTAPWSLRVKADKTRPDVRAMRDAIAAAVRQERKPAPITPPPTFARAPESYQYLPTFAKMAIERLDADSDLRTPAMLDQLLNAYAGTYGQHCDDYTRESAHYRATRRFWNFKPDGPHPGDDAPKDHPRADAHPVAAADARPADAVSAAGRAGPAGGPAGGARFRPASTHPLGYSGMRPDAPASCAPLPPLSRPVVQFSRFDSITGWRAADVTGPLMNRPAQRRPPPQIQARPRLAA